MRSSRTPHSVASDSSRSYISSKLRHRSCSSRHSDVTRKPSRKMKFIIAIGIALPIIAAIIGVVAWAVSADTGFQGPVASSLRRSDLHMDNHEEDIFQALEDRQDLEFSRHYDPPNQDLTKHDFSRLDVPENPNQFDDANNKDPLYIVHFVPSPKPKVEPSSTMGSNLGSTVSSEVLQKILSASKGAKPGTPQFVVFAPIPEEGENKNEAGQLDIGRQGLNLFSNQKSPNPEIDYEYEEELRKYQELLESSDHPPEKETSRVGQSKENTQAEIVKHKETLKRLTQNITETAYQIQQQQAALPNLNSLHTQLQPTNYNQHAILNQQQVSPPQQNYQQNIQGYSQNLPQGISQSYAQQPVQQIQSHDQYQQQYYPQESNPNVQVYPQQLQPQPQPQPQQIQPLATDRSGQYEPIGIKLNIGGGNGRGLLGGNYSPLGIIGSILRPLLPGRPQVNLNGKMMFGVMLEKGVKFGDNKGHIGYG